jgi:hypothetical protein
MVKRPEAGLTAAILVAVATSILLIQAAEKWSLAGSGPRWAGGTLWLLTWGGLTVITVILGRKMNVTAEGALGIAALCISLGALFQSFKASDVVAAPLGVTMSVVVMAAAAGYRDSPRSHKAGAITFWLLGACMLAAATWTCVFGR